MGFASRWVDLIMLCVSTVSYNVVANGNAVGPIVPKRDLHQCDPLLLYLFILCAEGLTTLLSPAEASGNIHGSRVCREGPSISHLLFADDSFLFFKAIEREHLFIKDILATYEQAFDQTVNFEKSGIFFSPNVSPVIRANI